MRASTRLIIGVIGANQPSNVTYRLAQEVGRKIAERGGVVVCGGLGGVMEAACKGAKEAGGLTIGILPGEEAKTANPYVDIPIVTGIGYARNIILVRTAESIIAMDGSYGTLSEIAHALQMGKPVIGIRSQIAPVDVPQVGDPEGGCRTGIRRLCRPLSRTFQKGGDRMQARPSMRTVVRSPWVGCAFLLLLGGCSVAGIFESRASITRFSPGETLYRIARTYRVDLDELVKANHIADSPPHRCGDAAICPPRRPGLEGAASEEADRSGVEEDTNLAGTSQCRAGVLQAIVLRIESDVDRSLTRSRRSRWTESRCRPRWILFGP